MVTKKRYVLSLRLRNSVLNNLIHSHGFDYPYKPTTPNVLSPCQIYPWRPTYGLLVGCFHLLSSNLTGLKVSSHLPHTLLPVPANGTRVHPITRARDWGCSSHSRGTSKHLIYPPTPLLPPGSLRRQQPPTWAPWLQILLPAYIPCCYKMAHLKYRSKQFIHPLA